MLLKPIHETCRFAVLATLSLILANEALAQVGSTDPTETRPKSSRPRLADLRGDDPPAPGDKAAQSPIKDESRSKEKEAETKPIGFFGDPRNFTRMGGWGSFGNAMGQFGFARATLIMMPPIQEELKLSDEQKKMLKTWQEDLRKKGEAMGQSLRDKNGDDPFKAADDQPITTRIFQFNKMMNQVSNLVKDQEAGLARILNSPQRKRLNQIALQMEGISALIRPEIAEALGLLDEDLEQIQQILNRSRAQQMTTWVGSMMTMRAPRKPADTAVTPDSTKSPKGKASPDQKPDPNQVAMSRATREKAMRQNFETMRDRTDQIQAKAVKEIINILSKAQRAKFEILLGPQFDPKKVNDLGRPPRSQGPATPTDPQATESKQP